MSEALLPRPKEFGSRVWTRPRLRRDSILRNEGWTLLCARHENSGVDLGARLEWGRSRLVCALEQLSGSRTEIIVANALKTQALDRSQGFKTPDLETERARSNSVNSYWRNDLARVEVSGWVFGTISATGWSVRPDRRIPYAVLRSGRTFGRLRRALIACHRSHFACSVSQI